MKNCSTRYILILMIIFFKMIPENAYSNVINLQSQLKVHQGRKHVLFEIEVSNNGSTRALDLSITMHFLDQVKTSDLVDILNEKQSKTIRIKMDVPENKKGAFPLICEIQFYDNNLFPFYSLQCTNVYLHSQPLSESISATVNDIHMFEKKTIEVFVKNKELKDQQANIKMILPGSFRCRQSMQTIQLNGQSEKISYTIKNQTALPETKHIGFILISYIKDNLHHSNITPFAIHVLSNNQSVFFSKRVLFFIYAGISFAWFFIVFVYVIRYRK